jgi:predicted CXXCH cytochrome family protein
VSVRAAIREPSGRNGSALAFAGALLAAACFAACGGSAGAPKSAALAMSGGPGEPHSNLRRADYAGSASCAPCHAKEYDAWQRSPMRRMTRSLAQTSVHAPFDGRSFTFKTDEAWMEQRDGRDFIRLRPADADERLYLVTKVIGGRYREDFVGREVDTKNPFRAALDEERVLPLSWVISRSEPRYKGYSVMVPERHGLEAGLVWKRACIFCHNTTSSLSVLYDDLYGPKAPSYQGSASNELPPDKAFRYTITDPGRLRDALARELAALGAHAPLSNDTREALAVASDVTLERFEEANLVELGIGCEACHGGSREHVQNPRGVRPSFALDSDFLGVTNARGDTLSRAENVNRTCAKCHTVLFSRYPYTWEGHTRKHSPGGSSTNSGEARDFLLGGCSHALTCTSCHDPHTEDAPEALAKLAEPASNDVCTSCHAEFRGAAATAAHSHHPATSAGSACVGCHMPKKNMGLDYELVRYHRIGSPTDAERVEGDRPLECALCHANRSVDQIVSTMERWWNKHYDRHRLERLYGSDLRKNPLEMTLIGGRPHERAVAANVLAHAGRTDELANIAAILDDEYPLVRYFGKAALERLTGAPLPLDMNASGQETRAAAERWLSARANAR